MRPCSFTETIWLARISSILGGWPHETDSTALVPKKHEDGYS